MDITSELENIDLTTYNCVAPTEVKVLTDIKPIKVVDIEVENDNSFYIYSDKNNQYILSHNCDGMHIASLYIGFFQKYAPSIVAEGKLCRLNTPLMMLKDKSGTIKEIFFNFDEYNKYMEKHMDCKYEKKYVKGLGSFTKVELRELISKYGLDYFVEPLLPDKTTNKLVDEWLSTKQAEARREYLRNNKTFSIAKV